ncbi:MAG: hypothetical protein IPP38_17805 [Bacteroidetes bacterium]|nr:hypothetical protein [Bacteroidota bacterium]
MMALGDPLLNLVAGPLVIPLWITAGCASETAVTISEPDPIVIDATAGTILCCNGTAQASIAASGGKEP